MSIASDAITVGFLGAGQLGEPMVKRLLAAGRHVLVYSRRAEVGARLESHGAQLAGSVAELARSSDILISCLFSDDQIRQVTAGERGLLQNAKPGSVFVSHTTGNPDTLIALADTTSPAPVIVDAPVSGTAEDIADGALTVLIGGPADAVQQVAPVLAAYADRIIPTGQLGSALIVKLINNALFASNAQLVAAALDLGTVLGVEGDALLSALHVCSGASGAAAAIERMGGLDSFATAAAPFLRKDIAASHDTCRALGVDSTFLDRVIDEGPLDLTAARSDRSWHGADGAT